MYVNSLGEHFLNPLDLIYSFGDYRYASLRSKNFKQKSCEKLGVGKLFWQMQGNTVA